MKEKKKIQNSLVIGVTGYRGRLGSELVANWGCIPLVCDVTSKHSVLKAMDIVKPDVVIHCAAVTDVDDVETIKCKQASHVNFAGTSVVRDSFDGQMIYMSTDYIFDGKSGPYKEDASPSPLNHYGHTKWLGEETMRDYDFPRDIIVRTTILYGGSSGKPSFVTAILDKLKIGKKFEVATALSGTPTYVPHLAEALMGLVKIQTPPRILNIVGATLLTRYEFALMIAGIFRYNKRLVCPTGLLRSAAKRPRKAGLRWDRAKRLGLPIYPVVQGLIHMREMMNVKTKV